MVYFPVGFLCYIHHKPLLMSDTAPAAGTLRACCLLDGFCVHVVLWIAAQDAEAPAEVSGTLPRRRVRVPPAVIVEPEVVREVVSPADVLLPYLRRTRTVHFCHE